MEILEKIIEWTKLKCRIQVAPEREIYFKEREIWWASIGANIGSEENGKNAQFERPVLVLKKFNQRMFWALPFTTAVHDSTYHYQISAFDSRPQTVILSQLRTLSSKRLIRKQRVLSEDEFQVIRDYVRKLL